MASQKVADVPKFPGESTEKVISHNAEPCSPRDKANVSQESAPFSGRIAPTALSDTPKVREAISDVVDSGRREEYPIPRVWEIGEETVREPPALEPNTSHAAQLRSYPSTPRRISEPTPDVNVRKQPAGIIEPISLKTSSKRVFTGSDIPAPGSRTQRKPRTLPKPLDLSKTSYKDAQPNYRRPTAHNEWSDLASEGSGGYRDEFNRSGVDRRNLGKPAPTAGHGSIREAQKRENGFIEEFTPPPESIPLPNSARSTTFDPWYDNQLPEPGDDPQYPEFDDIWEPLTPVDRSGPDDASMIRLMDDDS